MPESIREPEFEGEKMKMPNGTISETTEPEVPNSNHLALIVLLTLVILSLLVGLIFWFLTIMENQDKAVPSAPEISRPTAEENNEPESTTAETGTDAMGVVSTSDELSAIEADLESTKLDGIEQDFAAIEAELDAAAE